MESKEAETNSHLNVEAFPATASLFYVRVMENKFRGQFVLGEVHL
jgi:hypothetical protein